jgi:hypothetical protein
MGLRANLVNVILKDLPDSTSVLGEPSPRWDEILGGRIGPNAWGRYGRGAGTTCIIVTNGWAINAGLPADMVITTPTPTGGGTPILQAQLKGAKERGWLHTPVAGVLPNLRPGDIFNINQITSTGLDGTHEGVVLSATKSPDGQSITIESADGGQRDAQGRQAATRQKRTFAFQSGVHPIAVSSKFGSGWLDRWFAVGGDGPDDVLDASPVVAPWFPGTGGAPPVYVPSPRSVLVPALVVSAGTGIFLYGVFRYFGNQKPRY